MIFLCDNTVGGDIMAVELDKKTGKWFYYGRYPKSHLKAGKQYKRRGFSSAKKAQKAEKEFRDGFSDISTEIADMTFEELTEHYLEHASHIVKESTVNTNRAEYRVINKRLGHLKLNQLSYQVLQDYMYSIKDDYVDGTLVNYHSSIQKAIKFAIRKGWMNINHMQYVEIPKKTLDVVQDEILYWTPHQFDLFINCVDDLKFKTIFIVLFYMGIRVGEIAALSPASLDFENYVMKIYCQYNFKTHKRTTPKTKNSYRNITMPLVVVNQLKEYIERLKTFNVYDPHSKELYIFGLQHPLYSYAINRKLKEYIEIANKLNEDKIPIITPHGLRHSHASYLINNMKDKYSIYDIAKRLGHTVPSLLRTYAHWFDGADRKLVEVIDNNTNNKKLLEQPKNVEIEQTSDNKNSYIEELKELKELLDIGVITSEEFNLKKRAILKID